LIGKASVVKNMALIKVESDKQKVDPNLVAAIFYVENSHGWYGGLGLAADVVGISKSELPGNIRPMWNKLAGEHGDIRKLEDNIKASVTLIKRIAERLENQTVERVATLYNSLSQDQVSDYGARVGEVFRTHPWGVKIPTEHKSYANKIAPQTDGSFEVMIPDLKNKRYNSYEIEKFKNANPNFFEKVLNYLELHPLSPQESEQLLKKSYLKDLKVLLEQEKNSLQEDIHKFGIPPMLKAQLDEEMQQKNQQSQGRSLASLIIKKR
jgi:hypothetical protein